MTKIEFQRAKRTHEQMTRRTLWARFVEWVCDLAAPIPSPLRRAALDRKAEVERKAHQSL